MKRPKHLRKAYGLLPDLPLADLPPKYSNVRLARLYHSKLECSFCFPHGVDTTSSTISKLQRSWKSYRRTQWKVR